MKNKRAVLAAACAIILAGSVASAAIQQKFKILGNTAFASFFSTDDACVSTTAFILGSSRIEKVPGDPSSTSRGAFPGYTAFDTCTQNFVSGSGSGGVDSFSMNNLGSAIASVTFPLTEFIFDPDSRTYTQTPLGSVTLNAQWLGFGEIVKTKINNHINLPDGFIQDRFTGKFRDATIQATLQFGGENLLAGLSVDANLGVTDVGTHTVVKVAN